MVVESTYELFSFFLGTKKVVPMVVEEEEPVDNSIPKVQGEVLMEEEVCFKISECLSQIFLASFM